MSALERPQLYITPEEYVAGELLSDVRHEYIGGFVRAMSGASVVHSRIVRNLLIDLGNHLEGHPCEVFATDVKVRTRPTVYFYPDVVVCCDPSDDARYWRERPRYLFEVLSPETADHDRGMKALEYFGVPSLDAYFIVSQDRPEVVVHTRGDGDYWTRTTLTRLEEVVRLEALGFELSLERIYRRTGAGGAG